MVLEGRITIALLSHQLQDLCDRQPARHSDMGPPKRHHRRTSSSTGRAVLLVSLILTSYTSPLAQVNFHWPCSLSVSLELTLVHATIGPRVLPLAVHLVSLELTVVHATTGGVRVIFVRVLFRSTPSACTLTVAERYTDRESAPTAGGVLRGAPSHDDR